MKKVSVTLKPSQWVNFPWFLIAVASGYLLFTTGMNEYDDIANINWIFVIPIVWWFWKYLTIACWSFEMDEDSETIVEKKGVFSRSIVEVQYFRLKSIRVWKPFFLRIFGLSSVQIITSEPFKPALLIYAIYDGEGWAHYCKEMARYWRIQKGVKETDFHAF
jgi:uncharacterized membrane protein YdbT with pleckstrin-like domain